MHPQPKPEPASRKRCPRRKRKCPACGRWYLPHPHTAYHQKYCSTSPCQRERRRRTQARWRGRNPDYFKSDAERVRAWRARNARKRRRKRLNPRRIPVLARIAVRPIRPSDAPLLRSTLQDLSPAQRLPLQCTARRRHRALQDLFVDLVLCMICCPRGEKPPACGGGKRKRDHFGSRKRDHLKPC